MTCSLLHIDDSHLLWLFELQRFKTFFLCVLSEIFLLEFMIYFHVPSGFDDPDSLRVFTQSPQIHATCPLDLTVEIHFGSLDLWDSGVSTLN